MKVFVIVELLAFVMAFVLPLLPLRGSGELINLPADATGYFHNVLISFGLMNGLLIALVIVAWVYWSAKRYTSETGEKATKSSSSSDT